MQRRTQHGASSSAKKRAAIFERDKRKFKLKSNETNEENKNRHYMEVWRYS